MKTRLRYGKNCMFKPEGILPALVTPFTDDGKAVDEERLRFLVNRCIELGVHGVVPCGTTGEFVNMTMEERKRVIKVVVDEVNGRVPVVAGTGASGTDQALEITKVREGCGR
jgi:4-hydroxy-tetrahydrodipicolinate synthase